MTRLTVVVAPHVKAQLSDVVRHIGQDSFDDALAWETRVMAALDALGEFHGHAPDEDASLRTGQTIQKVVFEGTYLIHYWVDHIAQKVVVLGFRHGARLPRRGEP